MPSFSKRSLLNRAQLHHLLQRVVDTAIKRFDFTILDAQRGRAEQEAAFRNGFSKAHFLESAHNYEPAVAMDLAPYPINFNDVGRFKEMAKVIGYYDARQGDGRGIALELKIPLRWGADWDMDGEWNDEKFKDWGHWELDPWRKWAEESNPIED